MGYRSGKVFISYSHDSPAHADRVLAFANRLRSEGIDAVLDQFEEFGPPEGWPQWMNRNLREAGYVVMVCTPTYYTRVMGAEKTGIGRGVTWEGSLILQNLYESNTSNRKFLPVLFADGSMEDIPDPLRPFKNFSLNDEEGYLQLYRRLTNQPCVTAAELGSLKAFPKRERRQDFYGDQSRGGPPTTGAPADMDSGPPRQGVPKKPKSSLTGAKPKPKTQLKHESTWSEIGPYAVLSLFAFVCAVLVLALILWNQETLVRIGLIGRMYYVVLLALGLAVAAFLFGALRSRAIYTRKQLGGVLELRGPIVGAALAVIGGFLLPPPDPTTFPLTVFVHGEQGPAQAVLRNTGAVILDLEANRRIEAIGDKGQAYFLGIPANFRGQEVLASIEAEGYELVYPGRAVRLTNASVYLAVRRKPGLVAGTVTDENGKPLAGVSISIDGLSTQSDQSGYFMITIPSDRMNLGHPEFSLQAVAAGYAPSRSAVIPGKVDLVLRRVP